MTATYKVRNKMTVPLILIDGLGDEVQIPGLSTHAVDAAFIDFQMPPRQMAEVLGYDYNARIIAAAKPADLPVKSVDDTSKG